MADEPLAALGLAAETLASLRGSIPALHRWFGQNARPMPWRQTRDPYAIWISEVMLQQTQVQTVIPYYRRWLAAFPDAAALAQAPLEQVLKLWEGLGYYSRARNLHRAAQRLAEAHGGIIPNDPEVFAALPGVGAYTTAAVMSIALDHDLAALDGNVRRVLCRLIALPHDPRKGPYPAALQALAEALLPAGTAALHNQAMMELGALVCTPRQPRCEACPLAEVCAARAEGAPERYPAMPPRRVVPHHQVAIGLVFRGEQIFVDQRPYDGLLGGLWEFPGGKLEPGETVEQALRRELLEEFSMEVAVGGELPRVRHAYSHFKVTLHPRLCTFLRMSPRAGETAPYRWIEPAGLGELAMPRANLKVLEHLRKHLADGQFQHEHGSRSGSGT